MGIAIQEHSVDPPRISISAGRPDLGVGIGSLKRGRFQVGVDRPLSITLWVNGSAGYH